MYVYHFAIIWLMGTLFGQNLTEPFSPWLAFVTFAVVWVVASLSFQLMEKPIMDLKDRFFEVANQPKMV
jgi:peptidoglycan/LPS O-acetylase OafA/YrhL